MDTTLFLDVDTQVDFLDPQGGLPVPGAAIIRPQLAALSAAVTAGRVRGVATVDTHAFDDPEFATFPPHCLRGRPGQTKIPETLVPGAATVGEAVLPTAALAEALAAPQTVFEKHVLDGFSNPNVETALRLLAPRTVVVYGVATEYCVQAAVLGLLTRGYRVIVADDAIAGVTPAGIHEALQAMREAGASFRATAGILEDLR